MLNILHFSPEVKFFFIIYLKKICIHVDCLQANYENLRF